MRKALVCSIVVLLAGASRAIAAGPELESDEQKTLYALGLAISHNLSSFALSEADLELVKAGLSDGIQHKEPKVDIQTYGPKIKELQKVRESAAAAGEKKVGQVFLDKAAGEKGATNVVLRHAARPPVREALINAWRNKAPRRLLGAT